MPTYKWKPAKLFLRQLNFSADSFPLPIFHLLQSLQTTWLQTKDEIPFQSREWFGSSRWAWWETGGRRGGRTLWGRGGRWSSRSLKASPGGSGPVVIVRILALGWLDSIYFYLLRCIIYSFSFTCAGVIKNRDKRLSCFALIRMLVIFIPSRVAYITGIRGKIVELVLELE